MAVPILSKKHRKALFEHMGLHSNNNSIQYAAWAKYALKLDLTLQDCAELFMEGLHSNEIEIDFSQTQ